MAERKLRFAVGSPGGPRSAIWSLIGQKHDAYVVPIELKNVAKISFHLRTGEFSFGYTHEYFSANREEIRERAKTYGASVTPTIDTRDFERWKRPPQFDAGVTLPLRIYVANEALQTDADLRTTHEIRWVRPRENAAVGFVFLLVDESLTSEAAAPHPALEVVGRLEFPELAQSIVVLAHHMDRAIVSEAANRSIIEFTRENPGFVFPGMHRLYAQTAVEAGTGSRNLIEIPTYVVGSVPAG